MVACLERCMFWRGGDQISISTDSPDFCIVCADDVTRVLAAILEGTTDVIKMATT